MGRQGYIDIDGKADAGIAIYFSIKCLFVGFEPDFMEFRGLGDCVELRNVS